MTLFTLIKWILWIAFWVALVAGSLWFGLAVRH